MIETNNDITSVVTNFRISGEIDLEPFTDWLVKLALSGAEFSGFWSSEIIPAKSLEEPVWKLIQRFCSLQQAIAWREATLRKDLLAELRSIPSGVQIQVNEDMAKNEDLGTVATAIIADVKPGMEAAYWIWERKIQSAQAKRPGYRGVYLEPPVPGKKNQWTTLLRFDSPDNLEKWFASPERKELLAESEQFVKGTQYKKLTSSFPGWFPSDAETGAHPAKWKTLILVVLGLFPLLMLERRFILPHILGVNASLLLALTTLVNISIIGWITMPSLIYVFTWWLLPSKESRLKSNIIGCLIAAFLLVIEVALLWNLLPVMPPHTTS